MNKSLKKAVCLALCLCLLGSTAAFAAEESGEEKPELRSNLVITSLEGFLEFAEDCRLDEYSRELDVKLKLDLDLSGTDFKGVPIFCGSFDGQGHSITGFELGGEGSVQGLFRYVTEGALVQDLKVQGSVAPAGSRASIGGIVGSNAGKLLNCSFEGRVEGAEKIGGIVGENLVTGILERCVTRGEVSGSHFVGGVAGDNAGVIRGCVNYALVNTRAQENKVELQDLDLDTLINSENAVTVTDVGGITGSSRGLLRDCFNRGAVGYKLMGYNIGGIAGSQMGYIAGCQNVAAIAGRKEVGGIVGQMEPASFIAFEQDSVQLLEQQLDGMAGAAGQAATHAQLGAGAMGGYMSVLMGQITETGEALSALGGNILDPDTLLAAQAVISSGISNMSVTVQGMAATTQTVMGTLSNDIYTMQSQLNAMRSTLGDLSDGLGGTLKDRSDEDTPEQFTGKVESCTNSGSVQGELNVGGISGAMAVENDFDVAEDYVLGENNSLNFISELRAVVLDCHNKGPVSVLRMSGGGVAGWMQFGLVKDSVNSGEIQGQDAQYVGGVAGLSESYVRGCSANCLISGASSVGGIAGEGRYVSDCRSMIKLSGDEKTGAVLGYGVQQQDENGRNMIYGNYYLPVGDDLGGIDGISYEGAARPLGKWAFYSLEGLSDIFNKVYLRFVFEDGTASTVAIDAGGNLAEERIPPIPEKPGHTAHWSNFENISYDFDESFYAVYTPYSATLESRQRSESGLVLLLAEGSFLPGTTLELTGLDSCPDLNDGDELIAVGGYLSSDGSEATRLRYLVGKDVKRLRAFVRNEAGRWRESECSTMGSYAIIELQSGDDGFALVSAAIPQWYFMAAGGAAAALLLLTGIILMVRAGRRKKQTAQ